MGVGIAVGSAVAVGCSGVCDGSGDGVRKGSPPGRLQAMVVINHTTNSNFAILFFRPRAEASFDFAGIKVIDFL